MKTTNIANRDARGYVERREPFKGSNLWSRWDGDCYVVYSFDTHHPLFVYDGVAEQWYENMTYASRTTQKHRTQTRRAWTLSRCTSAICTMWRGMVRWV